MFVFAEQTRLQTGTATQRPWQLLRTAKRALEEAMRRRLRPAQQVQACTAPVVPVPVLGCMRRCILRNAPFAADNVFALSAFAAGLSALKSASAALMVVVDASQAVGSGGPSVAGAAGTCGLLLFAPRGGFLSGWCGSLGPLPRLCVSRAKRAHLRLRLLHTVDASDDAAHELNRTSNKRLLDERAARSDAASASDSDSASAASESAAGLGAGNGASSVALAAASAGSDAAVAVESKAASAQQPAAAAKSAAKHPAAKKATGKAKPKRKKSNAAKAPAKYACLFAAVREADSATRGLYSCFRAFAMHRRAAAAVAASAGSSGAGGSGGSPASPTSRLRRQPDPRVCVDCCC
jgi:hypothetical protein